MSADNTKLKLQQLCDDFRTLSESALNSGITMDELYSVCVKQKRKRKKWCNEDDRKIGYTSQWIFTVVIVVTATLFGCWLGEDALKVILGTRCVIPNNFLVWEATRPIADCGICKGVNSVFVLNNVSREDFQKYAYSYQPMLVKGAALQWPAMNTFSYDYFKNLFETIEGAYESVEEECQLLTFKTEFLSLKEVFSMSRARVLNQQGEKPWYIGWSNCHPAVLAAMRKEYWRPSFLPLNAEHSHHDFIFMGYAQGAAMHLDYISRLMWQAQLRGHKTWLLSPPPECEHVCASFSFRACPGDIVLLDTRQWYHKTQIDEKDFSLTVSSEYG